MSEQEQHIERPTAELYGKAMIVDGAKRSYNLTQDALDYYYYSRKAISQEEYTAGSALREAFARSGQARLASPSLQMPSGGGFNPNSFGMETQARQEVRNCLDAVEGMPGRVLVMNVVCYGFTLDVVDVPGYTNNAKKLARLREGLRDAYKFYEKRFNHVRQP